MIPYAKALSNQPPISLKSSYLIDIEGMKCGGCVSSVEKTLLAQDNVKNASVNLVSRTAWVDLNDPNQTIEPILAALTKRGFPASEKVDVFLEEQSQADRNEIKEWWKQWRQLIISILLLVLSVLGHLAEREVFTSPFLGELKFHAALATYALIGPGRSILKGGAKAAIGLTPNMDTLVGLGVCSAYITSIVSFIWPNVGWPCFFNEPVMLLGFVLLGRFLEERARLKTGKAIKQLSKLQPEIARLVCEDNEIREIRVGALKPGEKLQLLAGDRIPVDGVVIEGNSIIDISSITGEPLPLAAKPSVEVSAGSLNIEGTIIIEVKKVGAETALARIVRLVEAAQARKAPIQRLADQVAGVFCYGVVTISFFTFFFWWKIGSKIWPEIIQKSEGALLHLHHQSELHSSLGHGAETPIGLAIQLSIAVLVVACPCALGLATPTVITVASGQAAKKGWLFRGGDVIEKTSKLKQIVFDKTGTLTIGKPKVVKTFLTEDTDLLLKVASSLEKNSRHPLANAIIQEAETRQLKTLTTSKSKTYPGEGISGLVDNIDGIVRVGKPEWLLKSGVKLNQKMQNMIDSVSKNGESLVAVSIDQELLGVILIDDQIRENLIETLTKLRNQGFILSMLSGDRAEAVKSISNTLGFSKERISWQLLPNEKLLKLKKIKEDGTTAMVGDGINDAPALAEADIGIAIGTGTQIAQETADLVLLGDRIEMLPEALLLSKKAMKKVRQNLYWAFGYNLIAIPMAAGVFLPQFGLLLSPPIAALLMALSSITVVLNALSLK